MSPREGAPSGADPAPEASRLPALRAWLRIRLAWMAAAAVLLGGLALTGAAFDQQRRADAQSTRAAFDRLASERVAALERALDRVGDAIEVVRGLYLASERVTQSEFDTVVRSVHLEDRRVRALVWIEPRPGGGLVVVQISPRGAGGIEIGADLGADPLWRAALETARDAGTYAATGPLAGSADAGLPAARERIAVVLPAYAGAGVPPDESERRAALLGFAAALVEPAAVVEAALAQFTPDVVELELGGASPGASADGAWQRTVALGTRRWNVSARPLPRFAEWNTADRAPYVLAIGILVSLLAAVAAGAAAGRMQILRRIVATRTRERDVEAATRRRAAEALRRSEEQLRLLVEGVHDAALVMLAPDGTIASWNSAAERITGYPREEAIGRSVDIFFSPEDAARGVPERMLAAAARDGRAAIEGPRVRRDGTRIWAEVTLSALHAPDGSLRGFAVLGRDASARRAAEEEIRELNVTLERRVEDRTAELAAANAELEAFSYSVSHDLRAPLRAMSGYASMLLEDHGEKLDAEARRCLDVILRASAEMSALIDDLLSFSRLSREPLRREDVDTKALVDEVWRELAPQREGREIAFSVRDLPRVSGDRAMLKQVFVNLLGNAQKFTRARRDARIEVEGSLEAGLPVFVVRDNGVGFDMRYADRLFGVFQRLHSAQEYEGTGVGLALVQRIVLRHGGRVGAESTPGEGATFRFSLGRDAA